MSRYLLFAIFLASSCWGQVYKNGEPPESLVSVEEATRSNDFITQTVYGFLDFTTTIGNTVMVFSPQSAPPDGGSGQGEGQTEATVQPIKTKPAESMKNANIQPSKTNKATNHGETKKAHAKNTKIVVNSVIAENVVNPSDTQTTKNEDVQTRIEVMTKSPVLSTVVQIRSKDETPGVKNNLAEPEYDFLSKQPTEVIDETYKLINLGPTAKSPSKGAAKPRATGRREKENPTGLVTTLGGTIVKDGLTTVHETSVIGTYINGKYAQVLESSSRILAGPAEGKIRPSTTQRILKTIGPQHGKLKPQLEPTPTVQLEESSLPLEVLFSDSRGSSVKTTRRHTANPSSRPKFRNKIPDDYDTNDSGRQFKGAEKNRPNTSRPGYKNRSQTTTTETPATRRRSGFRPSNQPSSFSSGKQYQSKTRSETPTTSLSPVVKLKLPRTQGRWSYKTTPKPRVTIRRTIDDDEVRVPESSTTDQSPTTFDDKLTSPIVVSSSGSPTPKKLQEFPANVELDPSESEDTPNVAVFQEQQQQQQQNHEETTILPVETLNVEISTAADLNDVYFEIATIKSPYSFQVGTLRNTRYITLTSTIKKSFATAEPTTVAPTEPLTENILANTGAAYETTLPLDSSVATLPAISLEAGQATPPLETLTETFSTTQTLLKTHLLPVISGDNTTRITLVQTYSIARVVTAIKTLPPSEIYQFIPSKTLNEFNSKLDEAGSELHLELDFGEDESDDEDVPKRVVSPGEADSDLEVFKSSSASKVKPTEVATSSQASEKLSPEQAQQIALLKFFGQAPQPQVITTSRPVVVLETVYESRVIPVINAGNTILSTLSRPVATVPRTSYEYGTSTIATPNLIPPQVPQVPQVPLFPQQQPQFTITSAPLITQTLATVSDSRVLKLTFGAKTAYTTLFSTKVVPTEITTYVTTTIPIQPTVPAFPGYYPPPVGYPPYPFVG
ncbi:uncharacterized protein [Prorops nasuta]|uniref:uncharacterized protein n=1 Tax=Prorops nasuta TaxID=863751 RepID=UPI0034D0225D